MKGKEDITVKAVILRRNKLNVALDLLDFEVFADLYDYTKS